MTQPQTRIRPALNRIRRVVLKPTGLPRQLSQQAKEIRSLRAALKEVTSTSTHNDLEHSRVTVQMGVFEERMGRMEQMLDTGTFVADDAATAELRSLVDSVRQEHEQMRVRMQIVSHYEERLRRVEEGLSKLYDGDARHTM